MTTLVLCLCTLCPGVLYERVQLTFALLALRPQLAILKRSPQQARFSPAAWCFWRECLKGVDGDSLGVSLKPRTPNAIEGPHANQVLACAHCQGADIVRHGKTRQGTQPYRRREQPERWHAICS